MRLLALFSLLIALASPSAAADMDQRASEAERAYREGNYAVAQSVWKALLEEDLDQASRGRVLYNLGNTAYRQGELMEAIGWYTACIRTTPRHGEAWNNLEFARREAQLEPADRGDLRSTVTRLLSSVDRGEAAWMVVVCLLLWAVALGFEAVVGGTLWRRLSLLGLLVVLASATPLAWQTATRSVDPMLVVERPAAPLRTEPGEKHTVVAQVAAGEVVERTDELLGWVRVETPDGERGWTPESSLFDLD